MLTSQLDRNKSEIIPLETGMNKPEYKGENETSNLSGPAPDKRIVPVRKTRPITSTVTGNFHGLSNRVNVSFMLPGLNGFTGPDIYLFRSLYSLANQVAYCIYFLGGWVFESGQFNNG